MLPALAESWAEAAGAGGTHVITFTLRQGVEFHDGTPWNATVAAANFDQVLSQPLRGPDYHGWWGGGERKGAGSRCCWHPGQPPCLDHPA